MIHSMIQFSTPWVTGPCQSVIPHERQVIATVFLEKLRTARVLSHVFEKSNKPVFVVTKIVASFFFSLLHIGQIMSLLMIYMICVFQGR